MSTLWKCDVCGISMELPRTSGVVTRLIDGGKLQLDVTASLKRFATDDDPHICAVCLWREAAQATATELEKEQHKAKGGASAPR